MEAAPDSATGAIALRRPTNDAPAASAPVMSAAAVAHSPLRRNAGRTPLGRAAGGTSCTGGTWRGGAGSGCSAARTTSGVNGGWRKRTPVASKIALAIAAVPGTDDDSPAPRGGSPGRGMCSTSITGTWRKFRIG